MTTYGMVVDITRCNGCYNCFMACRDEFCGNDYLPYSLSQPPSGSFWMRLIEKERGRYPKVKLAYTPLLCMHCENASCVKVANRGEIYRREDGIIIIDPEKSVGLNNLTSSCPYGVIYWNEEKNIPQKCTMCAHLLDRGWKEPRCVEACPTGALIFGDIDDPNSRISQARSSEKIEVLNQEYGLKEKVNYVGLPKRFIAGTVIFGDIDECAKDVSVVLSGKGTNSEIRTDIYGDFEFENIPEGEYSIKLFAPGYEPRDFKVHTADDVYLGEIFLIRYK